MKNNVPFGQISRFTLPMCAKRPLPVNSVSDEVLIYVCRPLPARALHGRRVSTANIKFCSLRTLRLERSGR